jgi:hypothetical protein
VLHQRQQHAHDLVLSDRLITHDDHSIDPLTITNSSARRISVKFCYMATDRELRSVDRIISLLMRSEKDWSIMMEWRELSDRSNEIGNA